MHLFVYGSLRSGFQSAAYEYISRFFLPEGNGTVKGQLVDMGSYPAGVPSPDGKLTGELYRIRNENEFSWAIGQLDDYEGVSVEPGETPLYRREEVEVDTDGGRVTAWIYWYNGDVTGKNIIPSGDILDYLQKNHR